MAGSTLDGSPVARMARTTPIARLIVTGGLMAMLTACQAVTGTYENPSMIGGSARLSPFVAPDKSRGTVLSFLPFVGVPVNTADAIYKTIRQSAPHEGLTLALRLDEPATYRVKTYINAVGGTDSTTFVFIVEIYDVTGKRQHRFVGQETGPAPSGDPWTGIDSVTEQHLAERITQGVKSWLTRVGA